MFRTVACRVMDRSCERSISLAERAFQKIVLQRQLSDLGVKRLQIHRRCFSTRRAGTEDAGRAIEQLRFPGRDLVRMNIEKFRQFGQRLLALDGAKRHLCLEGRCVVPAGSSCHDLS